MQYALMIYTEPGYAEALSDAEREAVVRGVSRRWPMTPGASAARSCSRPRRRPVCGWSVAGR